MAATAAVLVLIAAFAATSEADAIEAARRDIRNGRLTDAEAALAPIAERTDQYGRIARFGLANVHVWMSEAVGLGDADRRSHLRRAIELYRTLRELGPGELPSQEDVLHNLLVAKVALSKISPMPTGTAESAPSNAMDDSNPPARQDEKANSPTAAPSERTDANPAEASVAADVKSPTPGIPDRDPGPLTKSDAEDRLNQALERWKTRERTQLPISTRGRRGASDF